MNLGQTPYPRRRRRSSESSVKRPPSKRNTSTSYRMLSGKQIRICCWTANKISRKFTHSSITLRSNACYQEMELVPSNRQPSACRLIQVSSCHKRILSMAHSKRYLWLVVALDRENAYDQSMYSLFHNWVQCHEWHQLRDGLTALR